MKRACSFESRPFVFRHLNQGATEFSSLPTECGSCWSYLEAGIVCRLVGHLKTKKQWKRDASSLRLLNRHWKTCVSHHIETLSPSSHHVISESEALDVSQFMFLTSLDAVPFVKRCLQDPHRAHCIDFFEIMSSLPFLRRLRLDKRILTMISAEGFQGLTEIECVEITDGPVAAESVNKLASLSLKRLVVNGIVNGIDEFIREVPSLRSLETEIAELDASLMRALCELEDVGLHFRSSTSRRSVDAFADDCSALDQIPGLKRLSIVVNAAEVLPTVIFNNLVRKLTYLDLTCHCSAQSNQCMKNISSHQLTSLTLRQCIVDGKTFMNDVPRLRELSLYCCRIWYGHEVVDHLVNLTTLRLSIGSGLSVGTNLLMRYLGKLTTLKDLDLSFEVEYGTPPRWLLEEMNKMSSLKSIGLRCIEEKALDWDADDGFAFATFEWLIKKPMVTELTIEGWGYRRRIKRVMEMQCMGSLKHLRLKALTRSCDEAAFMSHVASLRNAIPWVKVDAECK